MCTAMRCVTVVAALSMSVPPSLLAGEHVVQPAEIAARLLAAQAERAGNQTKIRRLLTGHVPAAARIVSDRALSAGVAALSDAELRDLARRADALEVDPVAGWSGKTWLIVGAAALVLVLLSVLIVEGCKEQGAECLN
jgi:hypothetical protein